MPWELRTWLLLMFGGIISSVIVGIGFWIYYEDALYVAGFFYAGVFVHSLAPMLLVLGYHELPDKKLLVAFVSGLAVNCAFSPVMSMASLILVLPAYMTFRLLWK
jgi:hypothetical protein